MLFPSKFLPSLLAAFVFGCLLGCGGTVGSVVSTGAGTPDPTYAYMTGNWQMTATSTSQTTFTSLAGFINESAGSAGTSHATTAVFQLVPGSCFLGEETLPLSGNVNTSAVSIRSFSDSGQFVTITGTENAAANQFTGTYVVNGGCANGVTGSVTGTKYAPLSGTYTGAPPSTATPQSISLTLAQSASGNGKGFSPVAGTAAFSGFPCFSKGSLQDGSSVDGSSVQLSILTDNNQTVTLNGTSDAAGKTISVTSGAISGSSGSCGNGSLQPFTLTVS